MKDIDLYWDTYAFLDDRIISLEDEFIKLSEDVKKYCYQNFAKDAKGILDGLDFGIDINISMKDELDQKSLKQTLDKISNELDVYYVKQTSTLRDIMNYQEENLYIDDKRTIPNDMLEELMEVNLNLQEAHQQSTERLPFALEIDPPPSTQ